jgi:hypothetical protein
MAHSSKGRTATTGVQGDPFEPLWSVCCKSLLNNRLQTGSPAKGGSGGGDRARQQGIREGGNWASGLAPGLQFAPQWGAETRGAAVPFGNGGSGEGPTPWRAYCSPGGDASPDDRPAMPGGWVGGVGSGFGRTAVREKSAGIEPAAEWGTAPNLGIVPGSYPP